MRRGVWITPLMASRLGNARRLTGCLKLPKKSGTILLRVAVICRIIQGPLEQKGCHSQQRIELTAGKIERLDVAASFSQSGTIRYRIDLECKDALFLLKKLFDTARVERAAAFSGRWSQLVWLLVRAGHAGDGKGPLAGGSHTPLNVVPAQPGAARAFLGIRKPRRKGGLSPAAPSTMASSKMRASSNMSSPSKTSPSANVAASKAAHMSASITRSAIGAAWAGDVP